MEENQNTDPFKFIIDSGKIGAQKRLQTGLAEPDWNRMGPLLTDVTRAGEMGYAPLA